MGESGFFQVRGASAGALEVNADRPNGLRKKWNAEGGLVLDRVEPGR